MSIQIIAEIGVNHNGDLDRALALVDAATEAGADVVKFQTFRAAQLAAARAGKAEYQKHTTNASESQLDMLQRLELSEAAHRRLLAHCMDRRIGFLSTPFDLESLRFLAEDLDLATLKISSGDVTNGPLLLAAARTGRQLLLSTGMSTLDEVRDALKILTFGYVRSSERPTTPQLDECFAAGHDSLKGRVTLLHCTTEYPAPLAEVNLAAMETLRHEFLLPVGFSDHSEGIVAPTAAAALGAVVIEKHFTLDCTLPGPDHKASLEPAPFAAMVRSIRGVELVLGDGRKAPTASEIKNMPIARKSLVATQTISTGESFTEGNLGAMRPGDGISPMQYWRFLGRRADRDYAPGEAIRPA